MGQLEKYGLYVMCLVIFLILGVTIWGGSDLPQAGGKSPSVAINAPGAPGRTGPVAQRSGADGAAIDLDSILGRPRRAESSPERAGGAPAVEATTRRDDVVGGPVAPPGEAPRRYRIKAGDTFDGIARSQLGSADRRDELMRANPDLDPRLLPVGREIVLPAASAPVADKTDGSVSTLQRVGAYRIYTIGKGDSLERIARIELGSPRRLQELLAMNPGIEPTKLKPGQTIKLPLK